MFKKITQVFLGTSTTPRTTGDYVVPENRPDPVQIVAEQQRRAEQRAAEQKILDDLDYKMKQENAAHNQRQRDANAEGHRQRQEADKRINEQRSQNSGGGSGGGNNNRPPTAGGGGSGGGNTPLPVLQEIFKASNRQYPPDVILDRRIFARGTPFEMAQAVQAEINKLLKIKLNHDFTAPHREHLTQEQTRQLDGKADKIPTKELEIDVAFYVGPQLTEINTRIEKSGNAPAREVDVAIENVIIEVTVSDTGKKGQIGRHIDYDTSQRSVILYAPNYSKRAAKDVESIGAHVVRNPSELADMLHKLKNG